MILNHCLITFIYYFIYIFPHFKIIIPHFLRFLDRIYKKIYEIDIHIIFLSIFMFVRVGILNFFKKTSIFRKKF